jgi:hypothetical protein
LADACAGGARCWRSARCRNRGWCHWRLGGV